MPKFCQRLRTIESISRSQIHRSLSTPAAHVAMARCRAASLSDPVQAMELLRSLVQPLINADIQRIMAKYAETYFAPAAKNAGRNLGEDKVNARRLVDSACSSALEHAKAIFSGGSGGRGGDNKPGQGSAASKSSPLKRKVETGPQPHLKKKKKKKKKSRQPLESEKGLGSRPYTDVILVSKSGKAVRREGHKWEPKRFTTTTLFILGSRANKALGFGQTRGRLYIKHPELFKYSGDQEDKEWLAKNQLMSTTGGKAYLMVLEDILELAQSPDYSSHPRQMPGELIGFNVPEFMVAKMRSFVGHVRTSPEMEDAAVIKHGELQVSQWEAARKKMMSREEAEPAAASKEQGTCPLVPTSHHHSSSQHHGGGGSEAHQEMEDAPVDDLGFLHGMNLTNLVRELEAATTGGGAAESLGQILSLADDNVEGFPDLPDEAEELGHAQRGAHDEAAVTADARRPKEAAPNSSEAGSSSERGTDLACGAASSSSGVGTSFAS